MRKDIEQKLKAIDTALPGLMRSYEKCDLCLRNCGVNRPAGERGYCRASGDAVVYSYAPHHGEEPPLSGTKGSGTIFFSLCNMTCVYCQNYKFSQACIGEHVDAEALADMMLKLQEMGCHNINFVSPTHYVPRIIEALAHASRKGLNIPLVYNTGGYDSPHIIKLLDGIIDIYLPDMRYSQDKRAEKYSNAPGYVANNRAIVKEMYRQVGDLVCRTSRGPAESGLIIRLLILPGGISGTAGTLEFIADAIGKDVYLSVMSQYYPAYLAREYHEISRRINAAEYREITDKLSELGFTNGWVQPFKGGFDERFAGENFTPKRPVK